MRVCTKCYRLGGFLLLAFAVRNAASWKPGTAKHAAENKAEQLARVQVVNQVEPLCRALFPDRNVLRFLASRASVYHKSTHRNDLWLVNCLDTDSNVIARVLWNPDTKRALQFNPILSHASLRQNPSFTSSMNEIKNEKEAAAAAREWAVRLRPISNEAMQKSKYRTQHVEERWIVRLYLPDGAVVIWINAMSGELQNAIVQDTPIPAKPAV